MKPALCVRFSWKMPVSISSVAPASPASVLPSDDRRVADPGHADADAVGGGRILAGRADVEPVGRSVEDEGHDRDEQEGEVDEHVLLEEHAADRRDPVEQRDLHHRELSDRKRRADELQEEQVAEAEREQIDADAADPLFCLERDAQHRRHHAEHGADAHADDDGVEEVARPAAPCSRRRRRRGA